MEEQEGISQEKVNLDYGECFRCHRLMAIGYLTQIRYYEGHLIKGKFHHKLICRSCKKAAEQLKDYYNGTKV